MPNGYENLFSDWLGPIPDQPRPQEAPSTPQAMPQSLPEQKLSYDNLFSDWLGPIPDQPTEQVPPEAQVPAMQPMAQPQQPMPMGQPKFPPMQQGSPFDIQAQPDQPMPFGDFVGMNPDPGISPEAPQEVPSWEEIRHAAAMRTEMDQLGELTNPEAMYQAPDPMSQEEAMQAEMDQLAELATPDIQPEYVPPELAVPQPIEAPVEEGDPVENELANLRAKRDQSVEERVFEGSLYNNIEVMKEDIEDMVQNAGALTRFGIERDAALANAPGVIADIFRAVKGEDKLRLAQTLAPMSEGLANKLGGVFGAMAPAVADMVVTKNLAGILGPAFSEMGYTKTAKALNVLARDPWDDIAAGRGVQALLTLMAEEMPFLATDIKNGVPPSRVLLNAVMGVGLGGTAESVIGRVLGRGMKATDNIVGANTPLVQESRPYRPREEVVERGYDASRKMMMGDELRGSERAAFQEYYDESPQSGQLGITNSMDVEDIKRSGLRPSIDEPIQLKEGEQPFGAAFLVDGEVIRGNEPGFTHEMVAKANPGVEGMTDRNRGFLLVDPDGELRFITPKQAESLGLGAESLEMMTKNPDSPMNRGFDRMASDPNADETVRQLADAKSVEFIEDEPLPFVEGAAPGDVRPVTTRPDSFYDDMAERGITDPDRVEPPGSVFDDFPEKPRGSLLSAEDPSASPRDLEAPEEGEGISRNIPRMDRDVDPEVVINEPTQYKPEEVANALDEVADNSPRKMFTAGYHAIASVFEEIGRTRLGRAFQQSLGMAGEVPEPIFNQKLRGDNFAKAVAFRMDEHLTRASDILRAKYGANVINDLENHPDLMKQLRVAVGSKRPYTSDMDIPFEAFRELRRLRNMADTISSHMIAENLVSGQLKLSMSDRLGTWLVRDYKLFDLQKVEDGWRPDAETVNAATNWATEYFGVGRETAELIVGELQHGSFEDAMNTLAKYGGNLERAKIRLGVTGDALGSTNVASGFVPSNTRNRIRALLLDSDKTPGDVNKMIDDFIRNEKRTERSLIEELDKAKEALVRKSTGEKPPGIPTDKWQKDVRAMQGKIDSIEEVIDEMFRRREIPEPVRRLWGEETNPMVQIASSIERVSNLMNGARNAQMIARWGRQNNMVLTMKGINDLKLDQYDFVRVSKKDAELPGVRWDPEDTETLYIHKDLLDALDKRFSPRIRGDTGTLMKAVLGFNHLVKGNLTFRNPGTHARNLFGASFFSAASGLTHPFNVPTQFKRLVNAAESAKELTHLKLEDGKLAKRVGKRSNEAVDDAERLIRLGLVDASVLERGLADNLKEISNTTGGFEAWSRNLRDRSFSEKALDGIKDFDEYARSIYRMEDDIARLVIWQGEMDEITRAYKRAGKKPPPRAELEKRAALIARDTYPNYDLLPTAIQDLRRNPIFSSFPSFAWEVMRVSKNQIRQAAKELDDPIMRARGIKRLMGITQVMAGPQLLALTVGKFAAGMSPEEMDALRRDQGDYQRYNTIVPLHRNEDGSVFFIDLGYTDPFGTIRSVFNSLADNLQRAGHLGDAQSLRTAMTRAVAEGVEPFTQQEILFGAFYEWMKNYNKWGDIVWREDHVIKDSAIHFMKSLEPGITKPIRRIAGSLQGKFAPNLTKPPVWAEAADFGGFRIRLSNPRKEYEWRLGRTAAEVNASDDHMRKNFLYNPNPITPEELEDAYWEFEDERRKAILDGIIATNDTRHRRTPEPVIESALSGMGLDKEEAEQIQAGVYYPKKFGPSFMSRMKEDFYRQALSKEDADQLWGQVQRRVAYLRELSQNARNNAGEMQYRPAPESRVERMTGGIR